MPGRGGGPRRGKLVRGGDYLYEIVGEAPPMRVGLVCSTEMLTTAIVDLHRGQQSELMTTPAIRCLLLDGRMNVYLPDENPNWWNSSREQ